MYLCVHICPHGGQDREPCPPRKVIDWRDLVAVNLGIFRPPGRSTSSSRRFFTAGTNPSLSAQESCIARLTALADINAPYTPLHCIADFSRKQTKHQTWIEITTNYSTPSRFLSTFRIAIKSKPLHTIHIFRCVLLSLLYSGGLVLALIENTSMC